VSRAVTVISGQLDLTSVRPRSRELDIAQKALEEAAHTCWESDEAYQNVLRYNLTDYAARSAALAAFRSATAVYTHAGKAYRALAYPFREQVTA
jgi:hypothetical protein